MINLVGWVFKSSKEIFMQSKSKSSFDMKAKVLTKLLEAIEIKIGCKGLKHFNVHFYWLIELV